MILTLPIPLTEIRPEALAWLWPGYIPRGKLTILDGDPNLGKSLTTLDLAARLSRGQPFPDGTVGGTIARTLIIQAEDGTASTVLPRLLAAGADLEQVFVFPDDVARKLRFPWNCATLERGVRATNAALVIVDPLMAFLSRRVWAANDQMIRRVLNRMAEVAERTGATILLVRHLNKSNGPRAMYRGCGSIAIVGAARSALLAAAHPSGDGRMVLAPTKSNLGPAPPAMVYHIVGNDSGIATIAWDGVEDLSADEALKPAPTETPTEIPKGVILATEWLLKTLKPGPRRAVDVYKEAAAAGFSERTLERAKEPAQVQSRFMVNKETGEKRWIWRLYQPPKYMPDLPPLEDIYGMDEGWEV